MFHIYVYMYVYVVSLVNATRSVRLIKLKQSIKSGIIAFLFRNVYTQL